MKIGFIGGGSIAFALANGFISAGVVKPDEITASCHPADVMNADAFKISNPLTGEGSQFLTTQWYATIVPHSRTIRPLGKLLAKLGATALFENRLVVERSEVIIVSVGPDVVANALRDVQDLQASKNKLFISVAMMVSTASIEEMLPPTARVMRVMPNIPALVKEGAAALCRGSQTTDEDVKLAMHLFRAVGSCEEVPEYQMDAVTALSGDGPAYVSMFIESLVDGGVRCGLPRDLALRLATQTTLGTAAMLKNGEHPAAMKDKVTSPAGSTTQGTYHLESNGFRAAVSGAVIAAEGWCQHMREMMKAGLFQIVYTPQWWSNYEYK